ncbi:MAG: type II toxin-antitoxin system PemK/MazF family toxin [Patescibacteria group bacterium]
MPQKDFDRWNEKKKYIHGKEYIPFFHEREVWWCSLGLNVGYEQDGGEGFERPMLVVKKFNKDVFWALPFTTSHKQNQYHFPIFGEEGSVIILSQLRLMSSKRLERYVYKMSEEHFREVILRVQRFFPSL